MTESGESWPEDVDFTMLPELFISTRDAKREDVGLMANIFIKAFKDDKTARLLLPRDRSWPLIVEMLRKYMDDEYTHVIVAWDGYTDTVVGWTSVSLVTSDQDDYFKFCDSTVWVGRQLLRSERTGAQARGRAPLHMDEMKRASLITKLREKNHNGQNRHARGTHGDRLVIQTVAIHPDAFEEEIPEIAFKLIDHIRDIAKSEFLPLWAQVPRDSPGDLEAIFAEVGFAEVGSFELNLDNFADREQVRRRSLGFQGWTQWVLRIGNWECGRRYNQAADGPSNGA